MPRKSAHKETDMISRRNFLQTAAGGAILAATENRLALASKLKAQFVPAFSNVIVAHDPDLQDDFRQPIPDRVSALLDRAIAAYTGDRRPKKAWRQIVGRARVVGIKVNGFPGGVVSTHAQLVKAITDRLIQADVSPERIIVWDRNVPDLQSCGLQVNHGRTGIRYIASDLVGYEPQEDAWGTVRVQIARILSECDMIINVPVLRDDRAAGVSFSMKNVCGMAKCSEDLEGDGSCPAIADLNCVPAIRHKVRFTIGDALTALYDGGPGRYGENLWYANTLIVGRDLVAIDDVAWKMIDAKRKQEGLKSLEAAGRPPLYIGIAADAEHALGTNHPAQMNIGKA